MRQIKIGIIGYGYMGKLHTMCYENLKYYYDMEGEVIVYAIATSKKKEELSLQNVVVYENYQDLIEDPQVDVVDICAPNFMHKEILIAAIKGHKYIYCEKPLALDKEAADAVVDAYRAYSYDRTNRVAFEYRFVPAILRAKELIDQGKIGKLIQFNCKYYGSEFLDPNRSISWQSTKKLAGGGVLFALGTHAIDSIRFLVGDIEKVYAQKFTHFKKRPMKENPEIMKEVELEDIINAQILCENGVIGSLLLSQVAAGSGVDFSIEIYGEHGTLKFDQANPNYLLYYNDFDEKSPHGGLSGYKSIDCAQKYDGAAIFPPARVNISWIRYHIASIYDFVHGVFSGEKVSPDIMDGYRVQQVTDAIYRSCEEGKEMNV